MASKTDNTGSSIFMSLLAVLFIGLKLTGYITWSWWWVLAPIWGPIALCLVVIAVAWTAIKILDR